MKVVYIVGMTRSGSTLLGNLLGELEGFFSAGEVRFLWKYGLLRKYQCACGSIPEQCSIWAQVLHYLRDYTRNPLVPDDIVDIQERLLRFRKLPRLLMHPKSKDNSWPDLRRYAQVLAGVYDGLAEVTGSRVLVDSTKFPPDAYVLGMLPRIDAYYVHLVRDPRAVAFSNQRQRQSQPDRKTEMFRQGSTRCTAMWFVSNLAAEAIKYRYGSEKVIRIRYEDLMAAPKTTLEKIAHHVGEPFVGIEQQGDNICLGENHNVWGNPSRFRVGSAALRLDDAWQRSLPRCHMAIVSSLSWPLAVRYGYLAHRGSTHGIA